MSTSFGLLLVIEFVLLGGVLVMAIRNSKVSEYRAGLLDAINELTKNDLQSGRPWKWRYDTFEEVSYDSMMLKFWKPLNKFYEDRSFLEDSAT